MIAAAVDPERISGRAGARFLRDIRCGCWFRSPDGRRRGRVLSKGAGAVTVRLERRTEQVERYNGCVIERRAAWKIESRCTTLAPMAVVLPGKTRRSFD